MNNFEKLYSKNRPINIAHEHCFDVTLADFEQIWNNFCVISLKTYNKKQKLRSFLVKSLTSFSFHFFLTP